MELMDAAMQWANRPDDERFESILAMREACHSYATASIVGNARLSELEARADGKEVRLVGSTGQSAAVTHYAFGQLARTVGAPADYLRSLPASVAATCINTGLAKEKAQDDRSLKLLFHKNGQLTTRAITSQAYDRVWNHEVLARMQSTLVEQQGWVVPPARPARKDQKGTRRATAADILPGQADFGLSVKVGDLIAPAGLYASDHDMFAFLVQYNDPIWDGKKFLKRGVFVQNSEVGDCALKFKMFLMDDVCGNHIVWGAQNITEVSIRHIKGRHITSASGKTLVNGFRKWNVMVNQLPDGQTLSSQIKKAQSVELGGTKDEVLDAVFGFAKKKGLSRLGRTAIGDAYDTAERTPRYGSPRSVWAIVNGLTENSQSGHTDSRTEVDVQAGRLMEMAF